ncbi:hypothetical protein N9W89_12730 [Hellea sp.]|nr:hypothetical protein [Hellea sp.]
MSIDFTQKKAPAKVKEEPKPAGTAKIPSGFAKRAKVPAAPSAAELEAASEQSPLKHPGDSPAKAPSAVKAGEGIKPAAKPRKKPTNGLIPEIPVELYIRGTARKSVLIEGPEQTIEAFKAFVKQRGVKNWEALQLLVQDQSRDD